MKKRLIAGMLRAIAWLPLGMLYFFSDILYIGVYYIIKYRRKVVRQNLREAFPSKSAPELKRIEKKYYHFLCDTIVETIKLLHISDEELEKRVTVCNPEIINAAIEKGHSAAILLGHYGNWEWIQEISRYFTGKAFKTSIYHPLKSKIWDEIYKDIRSHWKVKIIPQRQAVKTLLDKDNRPWICGFIADNRPDTFTEDNKVEFLNHYTSFIYGPEIIGRKVGAEFFYLDMERIQRGYYKISFYPISQLKNEGSANEEGISPGETYPFMRAFWHFLEATINREPSLWLWSHKRWKRDRTILSAAPLRDSNSF